METDDYRISGVDKEGRTCGQQESLTQMRGESPPRVIRKFTTNPKFKMIDFKADPKFWQRFLACAGFYKAGIDGDFGEKSQKALHAFEQASIDIGNSLGSFDGRSEGNIQTLLPAAQRKAREFMS